MMKSAALQRLLPLTTRCQIGTRAFCALPTRPSVVLHASSALLWPQDMALYGHRMPFKRLSNDTTFSILQRLKTRHHMPQDMAFQWLDTQVSLFMCRSDSLQAQGNGSELVWSRSTTHSFTASHLITPSVSWTGNLAPTTPDKAAFRAAVPAILAARQGSTASKLLGPQEVSIKPPPRACMPPFPIGCNMHTSIYRAWTPIWCRLE